MSTANPLSQSNVALEHDAAALRPGTRHWVGIAIIVLAGLAVYLPSLPYPMIYDDVTSIETNDSIRNLWSFQSLSPPDNSPVAGRPVANLTFAINYAIGGIQPHGYRLVNIAIHLANALLLLGLVHRSLRLPSVDSRLRGAAWGLAFAVALLWTVHPLNTEAVVYLTQRTELLASFFWLMTMWAALRGWTSTGARGRWFTLAVVTCALGMLSKEITAGLPLMVLLYDRAMISGSFRAALRQHRWLYAGLAATWLILLAILLSAPRGESVGFHHHVSPLAYLLTQSQVLLHYLGHAFWPANLNILYDWPIVTRYADALLTMTAMTALFIAACWALWRRPAIGMVAAAFFLVLGPSSSIVPIVTEVAADRRMYLPLAAVLVLVLVGLYHVAGYRQFNWPHALALLVVAAVAALAAASRVYDYRTGVTIWTDTVAKSPHSSHAHMCLAGSYLVLNGEFKALQHAYRDPVEYQQAVRALERKNGGVRAEQLHEMTMYHYQRALELEPGLEANLALVASQRALQEDPNSVPAHFQLAMTYSRRNDLPAAIHHYRRVVELDDTHAEAHNNLGAVLARSGQLREALFHFEKAVSLNPDYAEAVGNAERARAYLNASAQEK